MRAASLRFDKQGSFELGVLLYEMCAGEHPLDQVSVEAPYDTHDLLLSLPATGTYEYPPEFNAFVVSLLAFNPGAIVVCMWRTCPCACARGSRIPVDVCLLNLKKHLLNHRVVADYNLPV